jgi:hypothetical protein
MVRTNPDFTKDSGNKHLAQRRNADQPLLPKPHMGTLAPLYVTNPEGNQVELVCYDSSV